MQAGEYGFVLVCGIAAALVITALLSQYKAPVEVSGTPDSSDAQQGPFGGDSTPPVSAEGTPGTGDTPASEETPPLENAGAQLSDWRLVLVNADTKLPEDFEMTPTLYDAVQVNSKIYDELRDMLDGARAANVSLWIASCYRSVEDQEQILENAVGRRMRDGMTREEAYENARLTIQAPGYSEHHTGLAVDFNDVSRDFENTAAYAWLEKHAAEYGFVQRYPKDKADITGINFEPWHYRYVGREHAEAMRTLGLCLEEYVQYLREQP